MERPNFDRERLLARVRETMSSGIVGQRVLARQLDKSAVTDLSAPQLGNEVVVAEVSDESGSELQNSDGVVLQFERPRLGVTGSIVAGRVRKQTAA
jgi:hypothetical protein